MQWAVDSGQWSVTAGARVRESEIRSQREIADLVSLTARHATAHDLILAQLLRNILEELELCEWTGMLPGGLPWTQQVGWRVELWRAFWQERDLALLRENEGL